MAARRHAANTAEAAARTAVARTSLTTGFDPARATELAIDHAVRSGVDPADVQVTVRTGPTGEPNGVNRIGATKIPPSAKPATGSQAGAMRVTRNSSAGSALTK